MTNYRKNILKDKELAERLEAYRQDTLLLRQKQEEPDEALSQAQATILKELDLTTLSLPHRYAIFDLVKQFGLSPQAALKEIEGLDASLMDALIFFYPHGLRSSHLRSWQGSYFDIDHQVALCYLMLECGLAPQLAIDELSGLSSGQADFLTSGLTRQQIQGLNIYQLALLNYFQEKGLQADHLRQWKKANDDFGLSQVNAIRYLVEVLGFSPQNALSKINHKNATEVEQFIKGASSLRKPSLAVFALVEVADTLVTSAGLQFTENTSLSELKKELNNKGLLNRDLIKALKDSKIRDLYLFSDCSFNKTELVLRLALIELLKEQGFQVHGVITSADLAWSFPSVALQAFADAKQHFVNSQRFPLRKIEEAREIAAIKRAYENIPGYKDLASQASAQPGLAFEEISKALESKNQLSALEKQATAARAFMKTQAEIEGLPHLKAKMLHYLLLNNKADFKECIIFDTQAKTLMDLKEVNEQHCYGIDLTTVQVDKQHKNAEAYTKELMPMALRNACKEYEAYLQRALEKDSQQAKQEQPKFGKSKAVRLAKQKIAALRELRSTLEDSETQISHFRAAFIKHRKLIETRRDSAGITFLKVVATLLSLGLALAFGLWKVKGKEEIKKMQPLLEKAERGMAAKP